MQKVKDKEKILKAAREKQRVTYKGVPIRLSADFSKQLLQARRDWEEVLKWWKARTYNLDYLSRKFWFYSENQKMGVGKMGEKGEEIKKYKSVVTG